MQPLRGESCLLPFCLVIVLSRPSSEGAVNVSIR